MTEAATVIESKESGEIVVRFSRKPSCEGCRRCMMGKKDSHIDYCLDNTVQAAPGDTVMVDLGLAGSPVMLLLLYVLPLLAMTAVFLPMHLLGAPEYAQFLAALGTLAASLALLFLVDRRVLRRTVFRPKILAIVS